MSHASKYRRQGGRGRWLLSCLLLPAFFTHASGDGEMDRFLSMSLEELMELKVSISTESEKRLTEAPSVVTVLTADDIKATGATNLVEILESVPGVHVRYSQFAFRPLVQFRGADARQTLLMLNGKPVRDLMWTFSAFWKGMSTNIVERVEVIRGPGSALFGADASAGVINVITKTAGRVAESEAGVRAGSNGRHNAWLQHGGRWRDVEIAFTADFSETDGHDPFIAADAQTAVDDASGTAVSYAPDTAEYGWRSTDLRLSLAKGAWRFNADYLRQSDLEVGLTGAGVLDPVTRASERHHDIGLTYENPHFGEALGVKARLYYQQMEYSSGDGFQERPPGYDDSYPDGVINRMQSAERKAAFEASLLHTGFDKHAVRVGGGYTWQDLYRVEQWVNSGVGPDGDLLPISSPLVELSDTPYAFAPEKRRDITYLFLQDEWRIAPAWDLTAGARYDRYSDFGSTFNPRAALVWKSTERLTTKLMYGQAFRAPSYQELFAETSFSLPNPDLDPERSRTVELAFNWTAARNLYFGMNLFHFKQTDLIRAVDVEGFSGPQYQNTGEHRTRGIELEGRWEIGRNLQLSGNYTIRDHDDSAFRAYDQPDRDAYLRADLALPKGLRWNLQGNWVGERERAEGDDRAAVEAYLLTDTTIRYGGQGGMEFAVSIRNLFDVDARAYTSSSIPDDLPLPGRNYYAEIRLPY